VPVDSEIARTLHGLVLDQGVEIGRSERMTVDHGILQPVEFLYGQPLTRAIVPVFVNSLGFPLTPMHRVRALGEAFGRAAQQLDRRVLLLASGGISHSPPVPRWDGAPDTLQERLISYAPTRQERAAREQAIVAGIQAIADGKASSEPLNEEWDKLVLDVFRSGDLSVVDGWANDWFLAEGGSAAHEMRTWIAAYSALSTAGPYRMVVDHYWPVPTWGAGFGVQAAIGA
jgi:2,3-dihydroxyphenylpropionate 1,2-dioxygenase